MTLPHERTWAVVETRRFLAALLTNRRVPASVRAQAHTLLRHYPVASDVFCAGWQALAAPSLIAEPIFDVSTDGGLSAFWSAPSGPDAVQPVPAGAGVEKS